MFLSLSLTFKVSDHQSSRQKQNVLTSFYHRRSPHAACVKISTLSATLINFEKNFLEHILS
jgi:hypothetical protein